jgi:two-component system chemotaxis sensor kinase CheA
VGLDVVKSNVEKLNGNLELNSTAGKGTTLSLKLPLTLAIIPCLIVRVGDERFAIPQVNLVELVSLYDEDALTQIECAEERELFRLRNRLLPLVRLSEVLADRVPFSVETRTGITERYRKGREQSLVKVKENGGSIWNLNEKDRTLSFAVLKVGKERFGLIIDKVLGTEEIVVKPMHSLLRPLKCFSGATVMGDGRVALILDVEGIAQHAGILGDFEMDAELRKEKEKEAAEGEEPTRKLLLFKSGKVEQYALDLLKIRRIEEIRTSAIEKVGDREFITIDGFSTPIIRLHHFLSVSGIHEEENMYLVIPRDDKHYGILISQLLDVTETKVRLNVDSIKEEGMLGTAIVHGKMTLFPDLDWLLRHMDHPPRG